MNSRGGCWQPAFRYYEQHYSCARCIRNILEQTSFGGERPVGPSRTTSRMKRRICMAMRIIRSEEYLSVDRRFDAALMCPTTSSTARAREQHRHAAVYSLKVLDPYRCRSG